MKRMQRTGVMWRSRKRHVDARERVGFFVGTDFFAALVKGCGNGVAGLVEQLTDDRAFLFAERFHPLAPFGDAAAFSEIFYPDAFERFLVARSCNLAQCVIAQLFQRVHGFRESLNRYIVKSGNRISIHQSRFTNQAAFFFDLAFLSSALFPSSLLDLNASASVSARSVRILCSSPIPAAVTPSSRRLSV